MVKFLIQFLNEVSVQTSPKGEISEGNFTETKKTGRILWINFWKQKLFLEGIFERIFGLKHSLWIVSASVTESSQKTFFWKIRYSQFSTAEEFSSEILKESAVIKRSA